jgi:hypothetical protein
MNYKIGFDPCNNTHSYLRLYANSPLLTFHWTAYYILLKRKNNIVLDSWTAKRHENSNTSRKSQLLQLWPVAWDPTGLFCLRLLPK